MEKVYFGNKVGTTKNSPIILSDENQLVDSILGCLIKHPISKSYFSRPEMDAYLEKAKSQTDDLDIHLFMHFNNAVQMAHFNHQSTPVFLKEIIVQAKQTSSLLNLPNNRNGAKRVLRLLANALYKFRVLVGEEQKEEGISKFSPSEEERKQLESFSDLVENYEQLQNPLFEVSPLELFEYLTEPTESCSKDKLGMMVSLRAVIQKLFKEKQDFEFTFNLTMSIYLGLPIYFLNQTKMVELSDYL